MALADRFGFDFFALTHSPVSAFRAGRSFPRFSPTAQRLRVNTGEIGSEFALAPGANAHGR
jgi:hypothetical protein